jgi:poly(ADP-ribose) glycohydrolase ARH3
VNNDASPKVEKDLPEKRPYCAKLRRVVELNAKFRQQKDINRDIVIRDLGNDISALDSVPTAVFCYLMAQNKDEFESFKVKIVYFG